MPKHTHKFSPTTLCFAVLAALSVCSEAFAGNFGLEISNDTQLQGSGSVTTSQSGAYAGIYVHDFTSGGSHDLTIGTGTEPITVSGTGSGTYQFVESKWYGDERQAKIPVSGLWVNRTNLDTITIASGATVSGINGVSITHNNSQSVQNQPRTDTRTINQIVNNGSIQSVGSASTDNLYPASAGLLIAGALSVMQDSRYNIGLKGLTVKQVENNKSITSQSGAGVVIGLGATVTDFSNTGTITGSTYGIHLYYKNINSYEMKGAYAGPRVDTLSTTGTVSGHTYGLFLDWSQSNNYASIGTLKLSDSGALTGGQGGVYLADHTKIETIQLADNAKISSSATSSSAITLRNYVSIGAIQLSGASVIQGADCAIVVSGAGSSISKAIELAGTSSLSGGSQAIWNSGKIGGFKLSDSAKIVGDRNAGIWNGNWINKIQGLSGDQANAAILVSGTSSIQAGNNSNKTADAIRNGDGWSAGTIADDIIIEKGATVQGGADGFGIHNYKKSTVSGNIVSSGNLVNLLNEGTITGKVDLSLEKTDPFKFLNNGGTIRGAATIMGSGKITAQNTGEIQGKWTVSGGSGSTLVSTGTVGGGIDFTASTGDITVSHQTGAVGGDFKVQTTNGYVKFGNSGTISGDLTIKGTDPKKALPSEGQSEYSNQIGNYSNVTKGVDVAVSGSLILENTGDIGAAFKIASSGKTSIVNSGQIKGGDFTVTGASDLILQNGAAVSGALSTNATGNVSGFNTGNLSGDLTISDAKGVYFVNEGQVGKKLTVKASGGALTLTNKGNVTQGVEVSGSTSDVQFLNSGNVGQQLKINGQGKVTGSNSGQVAQGIVVSGSGDIQYGNSGAVLAGGITITGARALTFNNSATVSGAINLSGSGIANITNTQAITGALSVKGVSDLTFENQGSIGDALTLNGTGNGIVKNFASVQKAFAVTGVTQLSFVNTGALGEGLSLTSQGQLTAQNKGKVTGDMTLTSKGGVFSLENTADVTGNVTLASQGQATLQNSGHLQKALTLTGATSLHFENSATIDGAVSLAHSDQATYVNRGTLNSTLSSEGAGAVTLQNEQAGSLQAVTLTKGGAFTFNNAGSVAGKVSFTGASASAEQGDYQLVNTGRITGEQSVSNVKAIDITNTQIVSANVTVQGAGAMSVMNQGSWTAPQTTLSGDGNFTYTNTKEWKGDLTVSGAKDVTFNNTGSFSGNVSIGANTPGKVTFTNSKDFTGNLSLSYAGEDSTLTNTGNITGNFTLKGNGTLTVVNRSLYGGLITRVGANAKLNIEQWTVAVVGVDQGHNIVNSVNVVTQNENKLERKKRSLNEEVSLKKVEIAYADPQKSNPNYSIDLNNVFVVDGVELKPQEAYLSNDAQAIGFKGAYHVEDGFFRTSFDTGVTAGAIISKTLASQLFRRDFFIESVINESAVGAMYHRRLDGIRGTTFVKPYASYDTFDENGVSADGHTQGVVLGLTGFLNRHIITGIVGFERSQLKSQYITSNLDLDMQSWYAGLMTSHIVFSSKYVDGFGKLSAKASYTRGKIQRVLGEAGVNDASTNALAYGANAQFGLNLKVIPQGNLIPMLGVGYSYGTTQEYQLDKSGLMDDKYIPDGVKLPFADASLTWFQSWNTYIKTFVSGGYRYNLHPEQNTKVQFGVNTIEGTYNLPKHYEYLNASVVLHITKDSEVALGYTGVMDSIGDSHNVTAKYEIHF